jgi:acyl-CoA reductase-like NAD-dependent aldehyde dehydrogenase
MLAIAEPLTAPKMIAVLSPFDGSVVGEVPDDNVDSVSRAISVAERGFKVSRALSRHERAAILERTAVLVEKQSESYARLIAAESGKVLRAARKEVRRCVNTLKLSAEESKRLAGEVIPFDSFPGSERRIGFYNREPIGIVVAITPFNDPLNLVAHKLGPVVAAGNSVVLKLSELAPLSGIRLVELFVEAGLPPDVITVVTGTGAVVGPALVSNSAVRLVSFTGGFETARAIKNSMGLARLTMDLGGNGAVIVLDDCDVERAATETTSGAFWAAGQNCIGVQRVFVQQGVFEQFTALVASKARSLVIGDPLDERSEMGPMISVAAAERAEGWIKDAIRAGARLLAGGTREGAILRPTVLINVPDSARLACEEAFAPVVCINRIDTLADGIARANSTSYGIHAAIFTSDLESALSAAEELEAGGVMINDSTDYRLDSMPFGGVKSGSLGREGIRFAIEEMTQTKVICFNR